MECPLFAGVFMKYCVAERDVYMPSMYEVKEQCRLLQHKVCSRYMRTDKVSVKTSVVPICRDGAHTVG